MLQKINLSDPQSKFYRMMIKVIRLTGKIGVGKYNLPNILNWLAVEIVYFPRFSIKNYIAKRLILFAIYLNPRQQLFKDNLLVLGLIKAPKDPIEELNEKEYPYTTIPVGCKLLGQKIKFFELNQTSKLQVPKIINKDFHVVEKYPCEVKLPDTYLAEINNATVIGGTDTIIVEDLALSDEFDKDIKYVNYDMLHKNTFYNEEHINYIRCPHVVISVTKDHITLKTQNNFEIIDCAIHFIRNYNLINYYHRLIECLPRLSLINGLDKNIPILVDADMLPQELEALELINIDKRPLIKIKKHQKYLVKKLYYPSRLSIFSDSFKAPSSHIDTIISPNSVNFIRNTIFKKLNINANKSFRKIYISRKNSTVRKLLNSEEIESILITKGFEIVYPEYLSFYDQVYLFSQAKIIIGPTGAGITNLIFAPKGCNVLILMSTHHKLDLSALFSSLITNLDINLKALVGPYVLSGYLEHSDFTIDTKLVLDYLDEVV